MFVEEFVTNAEMKRYLRFYEIFLRCRSDIAVVVPEPMRDGPDDEDGWAPWKPVDSAISVSDVIGLEVGLGFRFPGLFRAYLTHKALLMTDFKVGFPETPVDRPLKQLRHYLGFMEFSPYFGEDGIIPFGWDSNDAGPVCFDTSKMSEDGDCPIVCVELDRVNSPHYCASPVADSFGQLLDEIEAEMLSYERASLLEPPSSS